MGNLSEFLMEELNVETAFTIPLFGGIEVAESTVISWVIMAIIVILTLVLTRNMRVENPSKLQVGVEYAVTALQNIVRGIVGHEGDRYVPYLATVLTFLGISNFWHETPDQGYERDRCGGADVHCSGAGGKHPEKPGKGLAERFYQAHCGGNAHQHYGIGHSSAVAVYASIRQCVRCFCSNEASGTPGADHSAGRI